MSFGSMFDGPKGPKVDALIEANTHMARARVHLGAALREAGIAQVSAEAALWKLAHPILRYNAVMDEVEEAIGLADRAIEEMAAEITATAKGES